MVLLVAEHEDGRLRKATLELVSAARELSSALGGGVTGLVLGSGAAAVAEELSRYLDEVCLVDHEALSPVRAETWTRAVSEAAKARGGSAILMSASRTGLSVGPRVAVRLDAPLLEDVVSLESDGNSIRAQRYAYLSRVTETVRAKALPAVVSVKPNVFPLADAGTTTGNVKRLEVTFDSQDERAQVGRRHPPAGGRVALEEASVVVTGGRGIGGAEGFEEFVLPLAEALDAGVGATRAVVDSGWRPYEEQIGQTGKTVAPDLYIALGVSGAVQHLSGMNRSKVVVAINKDGDAPIFKAADYGIVGDVKSVVPALREALQAQRE